MRGRDPPLQGTWHTACVTPEHVAPREDLLDDMGARGEGTTNTRMLCGTVSTHFSEIPTGRRGRLLCSKSREFVKPSNNS